MLREKFETEECIRQKEWQVMSYPTCNNLHELDLTYMLHHPVYEGYDDDNEIEYTKKIKVLVRRINNGYWRDVWRVKSENGIDEIVLKTMRYEHDYVDRNFDRHRKDALASERLSSSSRIVDMHSFCGNSATFELARGGKDLESIIYPSSGKSNLSWTEKVKIAIEIATAINDVHTVDSPQHSTIAHTDISPGQFLKINGTYKLGDFNRCRFLGWDAKHMKTCGFHIPVNPGSFRAPEEYAFELETEKVDIYSMGNIFYIMLTEKWPFEDLKDEEAIKLVKKGERPPIDESILNHRNPAVKILRDALKLCWKQDPNERATAKEIQTHLSTEMKKLKKLKH